jgi:aryl carrier-like protein
VRDAVVVAREDIPGDKRLVAYFTCRSGNKDTTKEDRIGPEELRGHIAAGLPEYMVPAAYVRLDKLPLMLNGKLDRRALPEPQGNAYAVLGYEAPVGETETAVAGIWAEVLKVERVGRHDNFFKLGGHSLLAVKVIAQMRRAGLQADVRELFVTPTLAELAAAVGSQSKMVEVPPNRIPRTQKQQRSSTREIELSV